MGVLKQISRTLIERIAGWYYRPQHTYIIKFKLPGGYMKMIVTIYDYALITMYVNNELKKRSAVELHLLKKYLLQIAENIKAVDVSIEDITCE